MNNAVTACWDLSSFLWLPAAELYGIQRIEYLDDVLILSGAGVGGGSHVYGNTLYVPPKKFFDAPGWAGITDWADELAPCIDQATRMLGVVRSPYMPTDVDRALQQVAIKVGQPDLHVMDGSVMPANPGVNPSLMITALAERAMSLGPNKGDADTRPALGSGYERVRPLMPRSPIVPAGAPGELRLDAKKSDIVPDYPY